MHQAAKFQFERTAHEFAQWRAVPEDERSPAPAWWLQPAFEVVTQHEEMGALLCYRLQLPVGSTYAAAVASQTEQIGMPSPRKPEPTRQHQLSRAAPPPERQDDPPSRSTSAIMGLQWPVHRAK